MVKICVRESKSMGTNCYVVSDGEKYIVIDPAVDFDTMDDLCDGEIAAVLITHGHFDHVEKLQSYLDNTNAKIYGQKNYTAFDRKGEGSSSKQLLALLEFFGGCSSSLYRWEHLHRG